MAVRHISQFAPHEITSEAFKESLSRTIDSLSRAVQAQVPTFALFCADPTFDIFVSDRVRKSRT